MRRGAAACIVIALIAMAPAPASARVFLRWPGAARWLRAFERLGAETRYRADITVNGAAARLHTLRLDRPIEDSLRALSAAFPEARIAWRGGRMAFAALDDGNRIRALLLETAGARTVVFVIELLREAVAARAEFYPPPFPGSVPGFAFENHERGFGLRVSKSAAAPATVLEHYRDLLASDGWWQPLPAPAVAERRGGVVALYALGRQVCIVHVEAMPDGGSAITLLHKRAAMP